MTPAQATKECQRRWGKNGCWRKYPTGNVCVGRIIMGLAFVQEGSGKSFADAFRDVDERPLKNAAFEAAKGEPCPRCSRTITTEPTRKDLLKKATRRRLSELHATYERLRVIAKSKRTAAEQEEMSAAYQDIFRLENPHYPTVIRALDGSGFFAVCRSCVCVQDERT